jgi:hypothetical protein
MNEAGECISFVDAEPIDSKTGKPLAQTYDTNFVNSSIANLSGFNKVGYKNNLFNADLYQLANMKQEGETKVKFDGSFENTFNSGFVATDNAQSSAVVISDAKILEKELGLGSYKLIPDGRAVAKTNKCVIKTIDNVGSRYYVASAYVFIKYGTEPVSLTIGDPDSKTCPLESVNDNTGATCGTAARTWGVIAQTSTVGKWVRLTGKFGVANGYQANGERKTKITIGICGGADMVYFDDVRLEPALKTKDATFIHSDCRLYPERDSMSCDYYDDSGLRKKGWSGYCLEYDPKNPSACLMWYPVDKVDSEEYEGGAGLSIAKDLYYCVDAEDQCNADNKAEPEFFCKKFVKVDREKYWYDRINLGSLYNIPEKLLDSAWTANSPADFFRADFGVNAGSSTNPIVLNQSAGSGFYGAYSPTFDLANTTDKITVGSVNKKLLPFVPYYGWSYGGEGRTNYFCKASLDADGNDRPIEVVNDHDATGPDETADLGVFDDCYVRAATQLDCESEDCSGKNTYCNWDYSTNSCKGGEFYHWTMCGPNGFLCRRNLCVESTDTNSCIQERPNAFYRFVDEPDVRCVVDRTNTSLMRGRNKDTAGDTDATGCYFDGFNHTKFYHVAKDAAQAIEAVKRLFIRAEKYLVWRGSQYVEEDPSNVSPGQCAGNTRPAYNSNNADYCYIKPTVSNVKLNTYTLNGSGWITLTFNSNIDDQQQPLAKYKVDWGFVDRGGNKVNLIKNVSMNPKKDANDPHKVYYFIDFREIPDNITQITPTVIITDNWEISSDAARVDQPLQINR